MVINIETSLLVFIIFTFLPFWAVKIFKRHAEKVIKSSESPLSSIIDTLIISYYIDEKCRNKGAIKSKKGKKKLNF